MVSGHAMGNWGIWLTFTLLLLRRSEIYHYYNLKFFLHISDTPKILLIWQTLIDHTPLKTVTHLPPWIKCVFLSYLLKDAYFSRFRHIWNWVPTTVPNLICTVRNNPSTLSCKQSALSIRNAWFDWSVLLDFAEVKESSRFWNHMHAIQIFEIGYRSWSC